MSDEDCTICLSGPVSEKCGEDGDCKICDRSVSCKGRIEPCGHETFHRCCIENLMKNGSRKCPLCRGNIKAIRHNFSEDGEHSKYRELGILETFRVVLFLPHGIQQTEILQSSLRRRLAVYSTKSFSIPITPSKRRRVTPHHIANFSSGMEARVRLFAEHEIKIFSVKCACFECQRAPSSPVHMIIPSQVKYMHSLVVDKIVRLLKRYDLQDEAFEIEEEAEKYLNEHARLFLHELRAWIESSFETLEQWHSKARYPDGSIFTSIEDNDPSVSGPPQRPRLTRRNAGLQA